MSQAFVFFYIHKPVFTAVNPWDTFPFQLLKTPKNKELQHKTSIDSRPPSHTLMKRDIFLCIQTNLLHGLRDLSHDVVK